MVSTTVVCGLHELEQSQFSCRLFLVALLVHIQSTVKPFEETFYQKSNWIWGEISLLEVLHLNETSFT